jgi:hypothetical protein
MESSEYFRKKWNSQQKILRSALENPIDFQAAVDLFMVQHAMLHSLGNQPPLEWSFSDEVWDELPEDKARGLPAVGEHSIAWLIWHLARCEDAAMNVVVAGKDQILLQDEWLRRMNINRYDTGNAMNQTEIQEFSLRVNLEELRTYRRTVGLQTHQIVKHLLPEELNGKAGPTCLDRLRNEGAVVEEAWDIAKYWCRSTVAGLLLMPATRHNMVHLNEALRLKAKNTNK